ncbi:MAG: pilin [Gammaproteobacteria bacterium]
MNRRLVVLILFALVLVWTFVLFPSKIELTDRTKVLQGVFLAKPYKEAIAGYWKSNAQFPAKEDWDPGGLVSAEKLEKSLVESIIVGEEASGSISVYFTSSRDPKVAAGIEGKKIVLTPSDQNGVVSWTCKGTLTEELLPMPCR